MTGQLKHSVSKSNGGAGHSLWRHLWTQMSPFLSHRPTGLTSLLSLHIWEDPELSFSNIMVCRGCQDNRWLTAQVLKWILTLPHLDSIPSPVTILLDLSQLLYPLMDFQRLWCRVSVSLIPDQQGTKSFSNWCSPCPRKLLVCYTRSFSFCLYGSIHFEIAFVLIFAYPNVRS